MADNIKAPSHYVDGREYEPKDVIRDWGLNFNLGSAVKYISRAGRKGDKLEDLQKAKQFLEFEIEAVEGDHKKKTMHHVDPFDYTNFEDYLKAIRANKECNSDAFKASFKEETEQEDDEEIAVEDAVTISIANQSPKRINDLQDRSYMFQKCRGIRMC